MGRSLAEETRSRQTIPRQCGPSLESLRTSIRDRLPSSWFMAWPREEALLAYLAKHTFPPMWLSAPRLVGLPVNIYTARITIRIWEAAVGRLWQNALWSRQKLQDIMPRLTCRSIVGFIRRLNVSPHLDMSKLRTWDRDPGPGRSAHNWWKRRAHFLLSRKTPPTNRNKFTKLFSRNLPRTRAS